MGNHSIPFSKYCFSTHLWCGSVTQYGHLWFAWYVWPQACGPQALGIYIGQTPHVHITTITCIHMLSWFQGLYRNVKVYNMNIVKHHLWGLYIIHYSWIIYSNKYWNISHMNNFHMKITVYHMVDYLCEVQIFVKFVRFANTFAMGSDSHNVVRWAKVLK